MVQSKSFKRFQLIGQPVTTVRRLSTWASDELICLDISRDRKNYPLIRSDTNFSQQDGFASLINSISSEAFMPITAGGGVSTLNDIEILLRSGADKVSINSQFCVNPHFIVEAAKEFGSQCIVASVDVKWTVEFGYEVYYGNGKIKLDSNFIDWLDVLQSNGAGEILINSIDNDGLRCGYDINLITLASDILDIPVIALGGAGEYAHIEEVLRKTAVSAVAAANIFHYTEHSVVHAKKFLVDCGASVRPTSFL